MKKDKRRPGAMPGEGINKDRASIASKRKAGFPGGNENVAGAGSKKKEGKSTIGSPPVSSDSLNFGERNKKK